MREIKRGEIYLARLDSAVGSEQRGDRPVLILQNDIGNYYSPTTIVAPLTSRKKKLYLPCHVPITLSGRDYGIAVLEQIRTIDKQRLTEYIGRVSQNEMAAINYATIISLGLIPLTQPWKGATHERTSCNG